MERSEPALVPEWLRNAGSVNGGGSVSHSDDQTASKLLRNKSSVNSNGHDFGRSNSSERTTSSYFRRSSSSNGSGHLRPHTSFGRKQHDRDWEKDTYDSRNKDRSVLGYRRQREFSDAFGDTSVSKFERDGLRHSHSVPGKHVENWHRKVLTDSSTASRNNANGLLTKSSSIGEVNKTILERDFPSLGADERAGISDVGRVPSPGLSSAVRSLPSGTSTIIGGEKWTSALAEIPVLVGGHGTGISSVQQAAPPSSASVGLGTTTSLNMAEAVAQSPSRVQTTPQLSVGTQRLEELAIKQSKQLIPMTPSMPKTLVLTSSDKQRIKVGQQHHPTSSPLPVNHSPRGGPLKGDVSKVSNTGKLHVLKPVREKNSVAPVVMDSNSSPISGRKVTSPTPTVPSVSGPAATRSPLNNPVPDRKPVLGVLEKRPTSQARSRNDFFNTVRKKSLANSSSVADPSMVNSSPLVDSGTAISPSFQEKVTEIAIEPASDTHQAADEIVGQSPSGDHSSETRDDHLACKNASCDDQKHVKNGKVHPSSDPIASEEEEATFLRSLGWEEDADEGGLTEEEISAFFRDVTKYINSKPSLKILQGVEPKFLVPCVSSGLSSPDAKLES